MILAIIVYLVLPSLKNRIVSVKRLLVMPAVFSYLLYQTITEDFSLNLHSEILLILGLIAGIVIGMSVKMQTEIKADRNEKLVWLPKTYFNLIMFLLIFSVHFVIGYLQVVDPLFFHQITMSSQILMFALAMVSSVMIGSNLCVYYKYLTAQQMSLSPNQI